MLADLRGGEFDRSVPIKEQHDERSLERALFAAGQSWLRWDPAADRVQVGEHFWQQVGRPAATVTRAEFLALIDSAEREAVADALNNAHPSPRAVS